MAFHLVDEVLNACGHGDIEAIRIGRDGGKAFVRAAPFDIQPVFILKQLPHRAALALTLAGAHLAQLVQGRFKFIITADKACGTASGQVVLFEHEHLFPGFCKIGRGGKPAVACAYNDHVVFLH